MYKQIAYSSDIRGGDLLVGVTQDILLPGLLQTVHSLVQFSPAHRVPQQHPRECHTLGEDALPSRWQGLLFVS